MESGGARAHEETAETGVIARVAAILTAVQEAPRTAAELGRILGYSRSTTYRLIAELRDHDFLARGSDGLLRLGTFPGTALANSTAAILEHLRDITRESVQLWVRIAGDRVCVRSVDSLHDLRVSRGVGTIFPMAEGGSASQALAQDGESSDFFVTREGRAAGVGSASVAFVAGEVRFALSLAYPLVREPRDTAAAFRELLLASADALRRLLERSPELSLLRDISTLSVGQHTAAPGTNIHG